MGAGEEGGPMGILLKGWVAQTMGAAVEIEID